METVNKKHSLHLDNNNKAILNGIIGVVSIFDKEIEVLSANNRIIIKGVGLTASRLNVEEGSMVIEGEFIACISYLSKRQKLSFKGMFK